MHLPSRSTRVLIPFLAVALTLTACSRPDPGESSGTPSGTASGTAAPAGVAGVPGTQAGRQLRWFLDAAAKPPVADADLTAHLSADFLADVPPAKLNELLGQLAGLRLERVTESTPAALTAQVRAGGQSLRLALGVDADGKINVLRLSQADQPSAAPAPATWDEVDRRLRAVAPDVGFLAAEVTGDGACRPVHAVAPTAPRPLGSIFKLYVLGAVAEQIRRGRLTWDTPLTLTSKVLIPPGELYQRPVGSKVTVREAAKLMISISDNAATDLLMDTVDRRAVESQVLRWSGHGELNVPFLTTREFVLLKAARYPELADAYAALKGERQRRSYLEKTVAALSLDGLKDWSEPRHVGTVEWFGSPEDVCRAFARLSRVGGEELGRVMSANDAGLGLDGKTWTATWYKGGSEVGLLTMGFLARSAAGKTYVVTALTSDPGRAYDEAKAGGELLSLVRGSFALLAKG